MKTRMRKISNNNTAVMKIPTTNGQVGAFRNKAGDGLTKWQSKSDIRLNRSLYRQFYLSGTERYQKAILWNYRFHHICIWIWFVTYLIKVLINFEFENRPNELFVPLLRHKWDGGERCAKGEKEQNKECLFSGRRVPDWLISLNISSYL